MTEILYTPTMYMNRQRVRPGSFCFEVRTRERGGSREWVRGWVSNALGDNPQGWAFLPIEDASLYGGRHTSYYPTREEAVRSHLGDRPAVPAQRARSRTTPGTRKSPGQAQSSSTKTRTCANPSK